MADWSLDLDMEGNDSWLVALKGSVNEEGLESEGLVDGRIHGPDTWSTSLRSPTMGADEVMEEMLGDIKDGQEDDGMEWVTLVESMVQEAWMNWEQSLQEAHWHWRMAEVVMMFGWLLGLEQVR